uniref:Uncharacterized protein n=1 Tax=Streptomyces sp. NBC_00008 TaxID=2903610 RepID=A0AAU2VZ24_9ACTN
MEPIDSRQALRILEDHAIVPRDENSRTELFAALAVLRILALGGDHAKSD